VKSTGIFDLVMLVYHTGDMLGMLSIPGCFRGHQDDVKQLFFLKLLGTEMARKVLEGTCQVPRVKKIQLLWAATLTKSVMNAVSDCTPLPYLFFFFK